MDRVGSGLMEIAGHRHYYKGVGYILIAWLLFTLMTLCSRYACKEASLGMVLFFQNFIGLVSMVPWVGKHGWSLVRTERLGFLCFRSAISICAIGLSFLAVQRTSLVDTMLFNNASPLWIPFVVWIGLRIPIQHILWPGLIGGFLGIILILEPGREVIQTGSLFAIGAGMLQAINMVSIRQLSKTERNHTVMFYYFLITSLICLPFAILSWSSVDWVVWAEIGAVGLFLTLGQWTFVRAFHHAKASHLGPFCYSAVVYSVLIDWILYNEVPGLWAWVGIVLIGSGGIWAIRHSKS